jgi:hypothetical protein
MLSSSQLKKTRRSYIAVVAITFDTLKYSNRLKAAGADPKIAEAEAEALAEVFELNLKEIATREDIKLLEERLNERLDTRLIQLEQRMIIKLGTLMVSIPPVVRVNTNREAAC